MEKLQREVHPVAAVLANESAALFGNPELRVEIVGGTAVVDRAPMSESIICERAWEFGRRVLKLAETLWDRGPVARHIASQLMRCGTSIGANAVESQEAQTKPDFIAKLSVSRKEARESSYWLRLAVASKVAKEEEVAWELSESNQLLAMIRAAIKTARSSPNRNA